MIPTATGTYAAEYTNTCSCEVYDPDTDESTPAGECFGDCWDMTVEDFAHITSHLFREEPQAFQVVGYPMWNGTVNGVFEARSPQELLRNITPDRTEWRITVTVTDAELVAILYYHDAPTGGLMTITPIAVW